MDLTESIAPKSDQINAEDLLTGPRTFTIAEVRAGSAEQPFDFHLVELPGRAYRPSKSMRRVIVMAWGKESSAYAGRRLTLYRDPEVTFGRDKVGGIKIAALSHLEQRLSVALTVTRGQRKPHTVEPLPDAAPPRVETLEERVTKMIDAFAALGVTEEQIAARTGTPRTAWTVDDLSSLLVVYQSMRTGESTAAEHFPA